MNELVTSSVQCPYCWEVIDVLLDCSVNEQSYIEDCQVCCRPINFSVSVDEYYEVSVKVSHEDEA
ncbi:MAG: CPXCG motif-containing cysteine-rich protein [Gammaproteobacteria bacterium]|nr:CPXCG motif-containing cysteine-rich protein [Gammaproteobacteria bacterium]MDX2488754.1 CPXCG motif-containing cysteine-rich protein [Gammaproteobacteria bacterium]